MLLNSSTSSSALPYSDHNHEPTVAVCPQTNEVLVSWYSTNCGEPGRCTGLVSARWAPGTPSFSQAAVDLDISDRCQCCTAYLMDRSDNTLYHFSAFSAAGTYDDIAGILRESHDCGRTWSAPQIIWPEHGIEHQIVVTVLLNSHKQVMVPCDHWGTPPFAKSGDQSIVQHAPLADIYSPTAWTVNNASTKTNASNTGAHHASIVELRNGSYISIGRGHDIAGTMAQGISTDGGFVWSAHASSFPGIHGGQREVMLRLGSIDQPIMCCTFANAPMPVPRAGGGTFTVLGLYCALSTDEGASFPVRRPITTNFSRQGEQVAGFDGRPFTMSFNSSEPDGYLAAAVGGDGTINLITSRNHYRFNLAWLQQKANVPTD